MMRRLALAVLLLLAGPGFASAQCGYRGAQVANGFACAVSNVNDTVACWGDATYLPGTIPSTAASAVDGGYSYACLIKDSDGSLECFGSAGHAELSSEIPATGPYSSVSIGSVTACALEADGGMACWGDLTVWTTSLPSATWVQMEGSEDQYCGVTDAGALHCWGYDLADVTTTEPAGTYTMATGQGFVACGIKTDQSVVCWGDETYSTPSVIGSEPAGDYIDVAVFDTAACAINTSNAVSCWGDTWPISGIPSGCIADSISCDTADCCITDADDNVACWGHDEPDISDDAPAPCPGTPNSCAYTPPAAASYCVTSIGG